MAPPKRPPTPVVPSITQAPVSTPTASITGIPTYGNTANPYLNPALSTINPATGNTTVAGLVSTSNQNATVSPAIANTSSGIILPTSAAKTDLLSSASTTPASGTTADQTPALAATDGTLSKAAATTVSKSQDEIIQDLVSGDQFYDNPANAFDNLAYHWRFFATADQQVVSAKTTTAQSTVADFYKKLAALPQITIAESGVTTYAIDEVIVDAIVGTDFQSESNKFTKMEMKISEPNGVNFLDSLRNCGIELGIQNYQKTFYYLELSFKGYTNDGAFTGSPFASLPNGGVWVWAVSITNIDVGMTASGGTYTVTMLPTNDSLLTGNYNIVPSLMQVSGGTVGEFMDNLCTAMNNTWAILKGGPGIINYSCVWHPVKDVLTADQAKAMPVLAAETEFNTEANVSFDSPDKGTAHITKGFTISRVLDALMKSCEQAQLLAKDCHNLDGVNDSATKVNEKGWRQSIIWRIEPELDLGTYDPLFNEYGQNITLHIYGFRHHTAQLSPQDDVDDDNIQKAIITDMAKRNFLRKKYEYLFTGVNSEVIDLDLNFNLAWQAELPRFVDATTDQVAVPAKVNPNPAKGPLTTRDLSKVSGTDVGVEVGQAGNSLNEANTALENLKQATPKDDAAIAAQQKIVDQATITQKNAAADAAAKRTQLLATRVNRKELDPYTREYGEDLTDAKVGSTLTAKQKASGYPVSIQVFDPTDNTGMSGQNHAGKSLYGAVLNQVYGPMATQFMTINMTVRGDPFWIGPGGFEQAIIRKADTFDPGWPNFPEGANVILFQMKYPLGQDENGQIILNTNATVTGIYQVNKVTHRFQNGLFTQVLNCTRSTLVDAYSSLFQSITGTSGANNPTAEDN